jgi:amino acid transporter
VVLFAGLHLAMLGTVRWTEVPVDKKQLEAYSLPAEFMRRAYGPHGAWAVRLITVLLIGSCFVSCFAGLLGYSRIPYGAARQGHFFGVVGRVHPRLSIPHVSLLLVGGMMLLWSFFDLQTVINALIITRILEQFIAQTVGLAILRRARPDHPRPFRLWLYPVPCALALVGWLYVYLSAGWLFIGLGLGTLSAGVVVFLAWSWRTGAWPFGPGGPEGWDVPPPLSAPSKAWPAAGEGIRTNPWPVVPEGEGPTPDGGGREEGT